MEIIDNRNNLLNFFDHNLIFAEIGVFKGEYSKIIYETIKPKELHLIDIFSGPTCSGDKDGNNMQHANMDHEYEQIKKWSIDKNVILHKGRSVDVLKNFEDNYFDAMYIDGDHSYEGIKQDIELCFNKIKNNGYMCGHDYHEVLFSGVFTAVNEFCTLNNLKINKITQDGCPSFVIQIRKPQEINIYI